MTCISTCTSLPPEPPAAMLRIDALSVSSAALPSLTFDLHGMLLDDVHLQFPEQDFLCSSVANLPQGVGVATVTSSTVKYDHSSKVRRLGNQEMLNLNLKSTSVWLSHVCAS